MKVNFNQIFIIVRTENHAEIKVQRKTWHSIIYVTFHFVTKRSLEMNPLKGLWCTGNSIWSQTDGHLWSAIVVLTSLNKCSFVRGQESCQRLNRDTVASCLRKRGLLMNALRTCLNWGWGLCLVLVRLPSCTFFNLSDRLPCCMSSAYPPSQHWAGLWIRCSSRDEHTCSVLVTPTWPHLERVPKLQFRLLIQDFGSGVVLLAQNDGPTKAGFTPLAA